MKLLRNTGNERVIDVLREWLSPGAQVDLISPAISIHAFAELRELLDKVDGCRLLLGDQECLQSVFGGPEDITSRGKLQVRWQARLLADWLRQHSDVRLSSSRPPQSIIVVEADNVRRALLGTCAFTTQGLGITPADQLALVQMTDVPDEVSAFSGWFHANWNAIKPDPSTKAKLVECLEGVASQQPPALVYFQILHQLFKDPAWREDWERGNMATRTGVKQSARSRWLQKVRRNCRRTCFQPLNWFRRPHSGSRMLPHILGRIERRSDFHADT